MYTVKIAKKTERMKKSNKPKTQYIDSIIIQKRD